MEKFSNPKSYEVLTYEDTLLMGSELAPLVAPDQDDAKAVRFDALMYGIELAYLIGKKYARARNDLLGKVRGIASVANIPEIMAQSELLNKILNTDYLDSAGINEFEHIRENLRDLMKYLPSGKGTYASFSLMLIHIIFFTHAANSDMIQMETIGCGHFVQPFRR